MKTRNDLSRFIVVPIIVMMTVLTIALPVTAQLFVEQTSRPLIDRDAFNQFIEPLDKDRHAILGALFADYASNTASTWTEFQSRAESLRGDREGRHALDQERRRYAEARLAQFTDDVRAVLADQDDLLARWNRFAAAQRRQRFLVMMYPVGGSFGNAELSMLLDHFELTADERTALAPVLDGYHAKLDMIVEAYARDYIDQQDEAFRLHEAVERGDTGATETLRKRGREYSERINAVANLNIETIPRIGAALSGLNRQRWNLSVGQQTQPPLFRSSPTDRLVEFLRKNESILSDAERNEMELIIATYDTERQRLRQLVTSEMLRYVKSQKYEQLVKEDPSRQRAMRASPVPPYLEQLFDLEERTTGQLRALIGEDRVKALPLHIRWLLYWDEDVVPVGGD